MSTPRAIQREWYHIFVVRLSRPSSHRPIYRMCVVLIGGARMHLYHGVYLVHQPLDSSGPELLHCCREAEHYKAQNGRNNTKDEDT